MGQQSGPSAAAAIGRSPPAALLAGSRYPGAGGIGNGGGVRSRWYNNNHRPMNLGLLMPAAVRSGATERILDQRRVILEEAYAQNPERFFRGIPKPSSPAAEVWINPSDKVAIRRAIRLPTDTNFLMQVSQTH